MSYSRTNWQNLPNQTTPINATNLNKIEQGIYDATYVNGVNVGTSVDSDYRVNFVKSKNLFDNKQIPIKKLFGSGTLNYTPINTGISVSYTTNESASIVYKIIDVSNYVGEKITIKANYDDNSNGHYNIGLCDANGENRIVGGSSSASGQTITYTIPTITTSKYLALWFYCDKNGTVNYTNLMVNFGDTALPYEPYVTPSINVDGEEIYRKDNLEQYSTNEIRIGTWIDGKPLYRKTFDISSITNSNTNLVDISSLNIDKVVLIRGCLKASNGYQEPMPLSDSSVNYSSLYITHTSIRGRADISDTGGTITSAYATIEYTKTTDTTTRSLNTIEQTRSIPTESTQDDER